MNPLESSASHDGPVHPGCLRPEDSMPLVVANLQPEPHEPVMLPAYGLSPSGSPPVRAYGLSPSGPPPVPAYGLPPWSPARLAPLAIAAAGAAGAWWYLHNH